MGNVFQDALETIFSMEDFSTELFYVDSDGVSTPVRGIKNSPLVGEQVGGAAVNIRQPTISILRSVLANPVEGAHLIGPGVKYRIMNIGSDVDNLTWFLGLRDVR